MAVGQSQEVSAISQIKALLEKDLPREMKVTEVFFDEDHTGDPAIRITVSVPKKDKYSAKELSGWSTALRSFHSQIGVMSGGRWPYFRLTERHSASRKRSSRAS